MYIGMIVAIILLIIFIMACIPLKYRASIHYEDKLNIECHALWIGKLFRFHFNYKEDDSLQREFYFLGKLRWGNAKDYQLWLAKKAQEELDDTAKSNSSDAPIKGQKGMPLSITSENEIVVQEDEWMKRQIENARKAQEPVPKTAEDSKSSEDSLNKENISPASELEEAEISANEQLNPTDEIASTKIDSNSETTNDNLDDSRSKQNTNSTTDSKTKSSNDDEQESAKTTTFKDLPQKIEAFLETLQTKKEEYHWALDKRIWSAFFELIAKLYRHSKPRHWKLNGVIGLGDPAYTAMVAGVFYATLPTNVGDVHFEYLDPVAKGHIGCKGRIYLPVAIWYLIVFIWTKPVRQLIFKKHHK